MTEPYRMRDSIVPEPLFQFFCSFSKGEIRIGVVGMLDMFWNNGTVFVTFQSKTDTGNRSDCFQWNGTEWKEIYNSSIHYLSGQPLPECFAALHRDER